MKYITKNSSHAELYQAYKEAKDEILRLDRLHKNSKEKKTKVIKHKNERYGKLSYKLFKEKQRVYGKEKHINNLQRHIRSKVVQAKKAGYAEAITQIRERDGRIIDMYSFLNKINVVTQIIGLSLNECAFLLWAGTYEFYGTTDFKRDWEGMNLTFYAMNNRMVKKGYTVQVPSTQGTKKIFALTGTGLTMFTKIDKFTKKHFEDE